MPRIFKNTAADAEADRVWENSSARLGEICTENPPCRTHKRDQTFLGALAHHAHESLIQVDLVRVQAAQLAGAQAASIQHLEHRTVPHTGGRCGKILVEQALGSLD